MSMSKSEMREIFLSKLDSRDRKKLFELSDETKKLFSKSTCLGYFPTIEDTEEIPTIESEGLTEEDLYNADDLIHPQQR